MLTLIMTGKLNDVDPKLGSLTSSPVSPIFPHRRLHELLPWEWKKRALQAAAA